MLKIFNRDEIELLQTADHHQVGEVEIHGNGDTMALAGMLEAYGLLRYVRGWQEPNKVRTWVYAITDHGRRLMAGYQPSGGGFQPRVRRSIAT